MLLIKLRSPSQIREMLIRQELPEVKLGPPGGQNECLRVFKSSSDGLILCMRGICEYAVGVGVAREVGGNSGEFGLGEIKFEKRQ